MTKKTARALCLTSSIVLAGGLAVAAPKLKAITLLVVGPGLTGGGTGPTTQMRIAPGGITGEMIQDGTIKGEDLNFTVIDRLRELGGGSGPQGPAGPQGTPGPQGPPGPRPSLSHASLAADLAIPSRQDVTLQALTQTVTVTERSILRVYAQAAFVDNRDNPIVRLGVFVDGRRVAVGYGQTSAPSAGQPQLVGSASTQRSTWIDPGTHTIEVKVFSEPPFSSVNGTTILGATDDDGVTFLGVALQ